MNRDEVASAQQFVEVDHAHAKLRRTGWLDEWVVGDQFDAEGAQSLCDEESDSAESNNADNLVSELDA